MLDAIISLGKLKFENDPEKLMQALVRKQTMRKGIEDFYVIELHFSTRAEPLRLQYMRYAKEKPLQTPTVLNYIGIVPASGLQYHVTGHDLRHLCSQVLPALLDKLHESDLAAKIQQVLDHHFLLDTDNPKDRYRYLLNIDSLGTVEEGHTANLINQLKPKDRPAAVVKAIQEHIHQSMSIHPEQVLLYTVYIDGELTAQHADYIQVALNEQVSMFANAKEDVCYVSGKPSKVSADLTKFKFKYYITDKLNFSSGISGKFERNFQLSKQAAWQMLLGERYIMNHLRMRIGGFNVYLIPEFLSDEVYDVTVIESRIQELSDKVGAFCRLKQAAELEETLEQEQKGLVLDDEINTRILLNFLFYEENKSEMKVFRHIKDVPPSRIYTLHMKRSEAFQAFKSLAPYYKFHMPSFDSVYYSIPLEVDGKGKVKNPQQLMQLYDAMLSDRTVERRILIQAFVSLLARIHHRTLGGLQIAARWRADTEADAERLWCKINWEQQLLLRWMEQIGMIREGEGTMRIELPERLAKEQEHTMASGFHEKQTALFLLGCTLNKIADAQDLELKSRPVIRKVNFRGMNMDAVCRLADDLTEKGFQYRNVMRERGFYGKYEMYCDFMRQYMDLALSVWNEPAYRMSDSENVYYILSGYSFANAMKYTSKQNAEQLQDEGYDSTINDEEEQNDEE